MSSKKSARKSNLERRIAKEMKDYALARGRYFLPPEVWEAAAGTWKVEYYHAQLRDRLTTSIMEIVDEALDDYLSTLFS